MNELICILQAYRNDSNGVLIDELIEIVEEEKINSVEELKSIDGEPEDIAVKKYLKEIDANPYEYDGLLYDEIQKLKHLRRSIADGNESEQKRRLVQYCMLTNRYTPFPSIAYEMIINGEI